MRSNSETAFERLFSAQVPQGKYVLVSFNGTEVSGKLIIRDDMSDDIEMQSLMFTLSNVETDEKELQLLSVDIAREVGGSIYPNTTFDKHTYEYYAKVNNGYLVQMKKHKR